MIDAPNYGYELKLIESLDRVSSLEADYQAALLTRDHGMAAVIKGELTAARAYLQAVRDLEEICQ